MTLKTYGDLPRATLIGLLEAREGAQSGIRMAYPGQAPPWQIVRRVKPRRQRIEKRLSVGTEDDQAANCIVEGECLQAMVSLYKYRGQVDLIIADPPYNTGKDFRYNDKWDVDPNDPELGALVPSDDGSRHSKWLRFMTPRLWMMREMLKPGGVLAVCIDHRELFRLGMLLDEVFREENRLGIINWQRTSAKNDVNHLATTTEYVLVYSKNIDMSSTALMERTKKSNERFANPDNDPTGPWKQGDLSAPGDTTHPTMVYAVQSPFDGSLHYPPQGRHWANEKPRMRSWLEAWGVEYTEVDLADERPKGLVIKGLEPRNGRSGGKTRKSASVDILARARSAGLARLRAGSWPPLYWGRDGLGKPVSKVYQAKIKAGYVPMTYWADEDYEMPEEIGTVSWPYSASGRSREGVSELAAIMGRDHGFETVKPLKLFMKLTHLWCPAGGIVMDPFAGSGTTAHAVLELNRKSGAQRRFILVEQGRPERGDPYARVLTAERVRRVILGSAGKGASERSAPRSKAGGLGGGFRFTQLTKAVDGEAVLALEREEMIDLLLTSHWDQSERSAAHLQRLPAGEHEHLFALNSRQEGYFLVWSSPTNPSVLNRKAFRVIAAEAKRAGLRTPYHVYARISTYSGPNIEFYQIPDRILEKLGFNEASEGYAEAVAGAT